MSVAQSTVNSKSNTAPDSSKYSNSNEPIQLIRLLPDAQKSLLKGTIPAGDRKAIFKGFIQECYGWQNFATANGYATTSAEDLVARVAEILETANFKPDSVLDTLEIENCKPSMQSRKDGLQKCRKRLERAANPEVQPKPSTDDMQLESTDTPGLVAFRELYSNSGFITISENFYKFTGTCYELVDPGKRKHEITLLMNRCISLDEKNGDLTRPYATSRQVNDAYKHTAAMVPAIKPDEVNTAGINCTNGVLKIHWDGRKLIKRIVPHDPSMVFLSPPRVIYDENADSECFEALMLAVAPEYRSIVLRTLAASLDLTKCKQEQHRPVRIAAFLGDGSNGKDALKTAMSMILGAKALTSVPLNAFTQYDQGRQFGLTGLAGSSINWPSENNFSSTLDSGECIKSVVTGEPLQYEEKNKQVSEFTPNCVLIFNGNAETIKLIAQSEAIRSRYAIVPFERTFKRNPDPLDPNELQADPRFKNPDWMAENVCSAMLNVLLEELENVCSEGIDYGPVEDVMNEHTRASFHLAQFVDDIGLIPAKGERVAVSEIWNRLRDWYKSEELLEVEDRNGREVDIFGADPRPGDKLIRSKQQLSASIVKFIDGAKNKGAGTKSDGTRYITGIKFDEPPKPSELIKIKLNAASNWAEYLEIARSTSTDLLNEAWKSLSPEKRQAIEQWAPKPESEPEPEQLEEDIFAVSADLSPVSPIKAGSKASYIGLKYPSYQGLELTVSAIKGHQATCVKPDGSKTTHLDIKELVLIPES